MAFFDLPDRQVVYLLAYLRDALRENKYANKWFAGGQVVESTMARRCFNAVVYKGEPRWVLDANRFPVLALWREQNKVDDMGFTLCEAQLCWFSRIPPSMADHDARAVGYTLASNMWHVTKHALDRLTEVPELLSTRQKAGVGSVVLRDGTIEMDETASVCGFMGDLSIHHQQPPYEIDDPDDLAQVMIDLKLYDSSQTDVDGLQGKYLGLTEEATIEPGT